MTKRRNPHVLLAWQLNGGLHRRTRGGERRHLASQLRTQVDEWYDDQEDQFADLDTQQDDRNAVV